MERRGTYQSTDHVPQAGSIVNATLDMAGVEACLVRLEKTLAEALHRELPQPLIEVKAPDLNFPAPVVNLALPEAPAPTIQVLPSRLGGDWIHLRRFFHGGLGLLGLDLLLRAVDLSLRLLGIVP